MIIRRLQIENFMCYYDIKSFEFTDGLNIILGENGEGKTKLFDAIEWVLLEGSSPSDQLVSQKKLFETQNGDKFNVSVRLIIESDNESYDFEKKFEVNKLRDNDFTTKSVEFISIKEESNGERVRIEGNEAKNIFNYIFPSEIRKYSMFRGESSLNIFSKKNSESQDNALISLINLFSDSNLYLKYANRATGLRKTAEIDKNEFNRRSVRNQREYDQLNSQISNSQREVDKRKSIIRDLHNNLTVTRENKDGLEKYITNAKANEDISQRINALLEKKKTNDALIDDQFNIPLLDDLWILLKYEKIQNEFSSKVSKYEEQRRSLQQEFDINKGIVKGRKELQNKLLNNATPLPIGVPDRKTMEEMLKDEICKVCNREAKFGSAAYIYMEANLNEFLLSLEPLSTVEQEDILFKNNYLKSLVFLSTNQERFIQRIRNIKIEISDKLELNSACKERSKDIQDQIDLAYQDKAKIFGSSDQSDEKLSDIMNNYVAWSREIANGDKDLIKLQLDLDREEKNLFDLKKRRDVIDLQSGDSLFNKKYNLFFDIEKIFIEIKDRKFEEYISKLEAKSNDILQKINVDSFVGKIKFNLTRVIDKLDVKVELVQSDDSVYYSPNQSLYTSMHISILFAISELAAEKKMEDFPLIFDAPTSSFGETKAGKFLNLLNENKSQKILLLKDFVLTGEGDRVVVKPEFKKVKRNKAYLVKLHRPFNRGLLHTMNTLIETI